jgi:hypothetical protein
VGLYGAVIIASTARMIAELFTLLRKMMTGYERPLPSFDQHREDKVTSQGIGNIHGRQIVRFMAG